MLFYAPFIWIFKHYLCITVFPCSNPPVSPPGRGGAPVYQGVFVFCVFLRSSIYVQSWRVCWVINSVSVKDTWEQIGTQIQASMKDNMTETLAARPEGAQCDIHPDCLSEACTHTCTQHTLFQRDTLWHACEPTRVASKTVKNIYTLLHQSRPTNELLTDEHTIYLALWGIKDVTGVLVTANRMCSNECVRLGVSVGVWEQGVCVDACGRACTSGAHGVYTSHY